MTDQPRSTVSMTPGDMDPMLQIEPDNGKAFTAIIDQTVNHIGSDSRQEIPLRFEGIAPRMARIVLENGQYRFYDLTIYPGDVTVNGKLVEKTLLHNGDIMRLQNGSGRGVTLTFINPLERTTNRDTSCPLEKSPFIIGRDPEADLTIDTLAVSWEHARIIDQRGGHVLEDRNSTNGTFVNDRQINGPHRLRHDDVIRIDRLLLVYKDDHLEQQSSEQRYEIDCVDLTMTVRGSITQRQTINILDEINLAIQPSEFVAIIGGSGSGKSTLLRAMNGANRATGGAVLINGQHLYQNYALYQPVIGYVPQTDIVQNALTVYESLYFSARLRFPNEPRGSRQQRIQRALEVMRLADVRDRPVGRLSGGQKKRVSTAMEIMAEPHLLFMDEPSSGLDPGLDRSMMSFLRRFANQGNIVIVVTHTTLNIGLCDKLLMMSRGQLTYAGSPREALDFFGAREYTEIYNRVLESPYNPQEESPYTAAKHWADHYKQSHLYQKYVVEQQADSQLTETAMLSNKRLRGSRQGSFFQQTATLLGRTLTLARRDVRTMLALMVVLPLVGLFLGFISLDEIENTRGQMLVDRFEERDVDTFLIEEIPPPTLPTPDPDDPTPPPEPTAEPTAQQSFSLGGGSSGGSDATEPEPDFECEDMRDVRTYTPANDAQRVLFMLSLSVVLLGIFTSAYTIVEEKTLFLRERMANLRIVPYLLSKFIVYGGLAVLSSVLALVTLSFGVRLPDQGLITWGPLEIFITIALTVLVGVSIGLFLSTINRQVNAVTYTVLAILFVQILFPGVLFKMEGPLEPISRLTVTRWSLESLGATANITQRDAESRFIVYRFINDPRTCEPFRIDDPSSLPAPSSLGFVYPATRTDLLLRWGVLVGFIVVFLFASTLALNRDEPF